MQRPQIPDKQEDSFTLWRGIYADISKGKAGEKTFFFDNITHTTPST
jgi:hypothetical protein